MSDFIVSIGKKCTGDDLLNLLKRPYGERAPEGRSFDFRWGSIAILEDRLARNKNIIKVKETLFGWVGDLVTDMSRPFVDRLVERIKWLRDSSGKVGSLKSDEFFSKLNGAFAIVFADSAGFCVVTDPLGFTQVYAGIEGNNNLISIGTHPDLVASISSYALRTDIVSAGEFLNSGTPSFPNTIYQNVKELNPGRLFNIALKTGKAEIQDFIYWFPPKEMRQDYNENELCKELHDTFLSAIRERCDREKKVGVFLSGGQDSRLVMAAVPQDINCIGLTFFGRFNREAQTARKSAKCYNREWLPLLRNPEFLGNTVVDAVKFVGCEFEWVNAQTIGFAKDISKLNIYVILGGIQFDTYLKGYYAEDWFLEKRLGGLLPSKYKLKAYDPVKCLSIFWKETLKEEIVEQVYSRRKCTYNESLAQGRGSIAEWLILYPFSQDGTNGWWSAERRILPVKLVAADRRLLDFAFKCPVELKLGGRLFVMAAKNICGPGLCIPSANDGVRLGSGHWSRLVQRAIRKFQDRTTSILEKLGKEPKIQHSWHDYQRYWRESEKLRELIHEYGANLEQFDGILFKESGRALLERKDIDWRSGFRLLQLAIWLGIKENYALVP
jgi:hypothetical protein